MTARSLRDEIKQSKPFDNLESAAVLNIRRTSDHLHRSFQQMMKVPNLTDSQYNVLRILRGAGTHGFRCSEIGERMVSHDPDITRLLDRLNRRKLIKRHRNPQDRRVVCASITEAGLEQLRSLDPLVKSYGTAALQHLSRRKLETLLQLLQEVRSGND